jgi:hypothetical protein
MKFFEWIEISLKIYGKYMLLPNISAQPVAKDSRILSDKFAEKHDVTNCQFSGKFELQRLPDI